MRRCKKCGSKLKNREKIGDRWINTQNRKFCLSCSPYGSHNTIDISKYRIGFKVCPVCKIEKPTDQFHQRSARNNRPAGYCKSCASQKNAELKRSYKEYLVKYKGGKCQVCGYSKCLAALDFHHKDRREKSVDYYKMKNWSTQRRLAEVDKCMLVCANCHREIEDEYRRTVGEAVNTSS